MVKENILTFDIGGKSIKFTIFKNHKQVFKTQSVAINNSNRSEILSIMKQIYQKYASKISGIAISSPGAIRSDGTICGPSAINDYLNFNLKDEVATRFNFKGKITVINDANAAAYADYKTIKPFSSIVTIAVGTGVGGGVIINGKLVYGKSGYGGEIGLMASPYGADNEAKNYRICSTQSGFYSLETYYQKISSVKKDGAEIFKLYDQGDKKALQAVTRMYQSLALTIFNIFVLIDPDYIFLAGGLSNRTSAPKEIARYVLEIKNQLQLDVQIGTIKNSSLPWEGQLWGAYEFFLDS